MRVAFTTTDGTTIDQHFGQAARFDVWEVGPDAAEPVESVQAITTAADEEDRINARASALFGCTIVCTVQIGGPAAAKLVARRIHPLKTDQDASVKETIEKLQKVLRGNPPPWLRKVLAGQAPVKDT